MRRLIGVAAAALFLAGSVEPGFASQGKGKKHGQHERATHARDNGSDAKVVVDITFSRADVRVIRQHYAPRYGNLPPGLKKKVARGGELPPGWRKKFEPFPVAVERKLPALPHGYRRGVVDGHAVIFDSRRNVVVDVAVLF